MQAVVRMVSDGDLVGAGDGGPGGVPCRPLLGRVAGRFHAGRVGFVIPAVHLAVGADVGGALLPFQPVQRITGHAPESVDSPSWRGLGGELANALLPCVHRRRQLVQVLLPVGFGRERYLFRPCSPLRRD